MLHFSASYVLWNRGNIINETGTVSVVMMQELTLQTSGARSRTFGLIYSRTSEGRGNDCRASLATSSMPPSNAAYCQLFQHHLHLDSPNARWRRRQTPRLAIMFQSSRPASPLEPTDAAASEASGEIHKHAVSRDIFNGSACLQSCQQCRTWRLTAESVQSVWRPPSQASLL